MIGINLSNSQGSLLVAISIYLEDDLKVDARKLCSLTIVGKITFSGRTFFSFVNLSH